MLNDNWTLTAALGVPNEGTTTVNLEEFAGLHGAMTHLVGLPSRTTYVFGDSSLVIGAMQKKLSCRSDCELSIQTFGCQSYGRKALIRIFY